MQILSKMYTYITEYHLLITERPFPIVINFKLRDRTYWLGEIALITLNANPQDALLGLAEEELLLKHATTQVIAI